MPALQTTYRNDLSELARLAADIEAFCEKNGVDGEAAQALQLCLDEAATNVISYAWSDGAPHTFSLSLAAGADAVIAVLRDDGAPFNPLVDAAAPDLTASLETRAIGGLGIHFCKTLMRRLDYARDGGCNVFTLERARK